MPRGPRRGRAELQGGKGKGDRGPSRALHPLLRGEPGAGGPCPPRQPPSPRLAVCSRGRGRPLTGLRGVAIGRVRLNVDVLHARDAAAQNGAHGARRAGLGWDADGSSGVLTRTWPRPGHTDACPRPRKPRPPSPHLRLGPGPDATAALRPPCPRHVGKRSPLAAEGAGLLRRKPA